MTSPNSHDSPTSPAVPMRDRYRGSLLGLAVGDALGGTLEFKCPGTFPPLTDMIGGGVWNLRPGDWTDDTSMALCLAASLVECGRFDPEDQMKRYVRWYREGYMTPQGKLPPDIGNTTRDALCKFEETGDPWAGSTDPYTAGNGSLMRLAPVPLFFADAPREAIERAADSSKTTHAAVEAVDACRYYAGLIVGALNGATKDALLGDSPYSPEVGIWERNPLRGKIPDVAGGSFKRKEPDKDPPDQIKGKGYVVQTLEAVLWAFNKSTTFDDGALLVVNLGCDADTTGAVYGQLAGAYYGVEAIREDWRRKVAKHDEIVGLADGLLAASEGRSGA